MMTMSAINPHRFPCRASCCAFVLGLAVLIPSLGYANSAALTGRPSPEGGGRLQVDEDNGLKIRKETVTFDILEERLEARVTVAYQVENTRDAPYEGELLFVVPDVDAVRELGITVGGETARAVRMEGVVLDPAIHARFDEYAGFHFPFHLDPRATETVTFEYIQEPGWKSDRNNPSYAATAHLLNLVRGVSTRTVFFEYYLFPILTFSEGVDEVEIRVSWPTHSAWRERVESFQSNLPLQRVSSDRRRRIYRGRFTDVPADIFEFSFYVGRPNRLGFTLYPAYRLSLPAKHHAFSLALLFDVLVRNFQFSLGAQYGTVDTFELLQEVKMFPPGASKSIGMVVDYRFSLGVVEQLLPFVDVGFKASAGIRLFLALELTYQMFPPLVTDGWTHEVLIGIPFSF
jgi:hypothetical protein